VLYIPISLLSKLQILIVYWNQKHPKKQKSITTTAQHPQIRKKNWGLSSYLSTDQQLPALCVCVCVCLSLSLLICRLLSTFTYTHKRNRTSKLLFRSNLLLLPLLKTSAVREDELMATDYKSRCKRVIKCEIRRYQTRTERTYPAATRKQRPYISGFPLDPSTHTHTHCVCNYCDHNNLMERDP